MERPGGGTGGGGGGGCQGGGVTVVAATQRRHWLRAGGGRRQQTGLRRPHYQDVRCRGGGGGPRHGEAGVVGVHRLRGELGPTVVGGVTQAGGSHLQSAGQLAGRRPARREGRRAGENVTGQSRGDTGVLGPGTVSYGFRAFCVFSFTFDNELH